jgi:hypothetical protein
MEILLIGAAILLAMNCVVSLRIWLSKGLTGVQKFAQTCIVWLVPVMGAVLVYLVQRSDGDSRDPGKPPFGGGAGDGMPGGVQ